MAAALGPLLDRLVFVGGCAAGLLVDDPGAAPIRATLDVDLVAHVTALAAYHDLEREFIQLGFRRDTTSDVACRLIFRGIQVDLMPSDPVVLGVANRWYPLAMDTAQRFSLPGGAVIRLVSGPAFLATKFEAFADRGKGDPLASHDLEDILTVLASRVRILEEIHESPLELQNYLAERCRGLLALRDFENYVPGLVGEDSNGDPTALVLQRLREITAIG